MPLEFFLNFDQCKECISYSSVMCICISALFCISIVAALRAQSISYSCAILCISALLCISCRINIKRSSFASKAMAVACCTAGAFCILHKTFAKSSRHDASSLAKPLATLQTASWPQAAINKLQSKLMHSSYRSNLIKMIHLGRFSGCSVLCYIEITTRLNIKRCICLFESMECSN